MNGPSLLLLPLVGLMAACASISASSDPIVAGAGATDHGAVGAGEGPAWHQGYLYCTDGKHVNRFDPRTGKSSVFLDHCGSPNGLYFDTEARLILCESDGRRLSRMEKSGKLAALTDNYEGMRYNSPNDVTMDSRGRIYFTDPRYGSRDTMELKDKSGHLVEGVYRVDAPGKVTRVLTQPEVDRPNGLLVSPGDKYLYICDNDNNRHGGARLLTRFDLKADGTVDGASRKVIFDWKQGRGPDGMKMDSAGRIYLQAGVNKANEFETDEFKAGCYILSPEGQLIRFIPTWPDEATNCAFGGDDFKTLYLTSGGHLWSVPLTTRGWKVNTLFVTKGEAPSATTNEYGVPFEVNSVQFLY